MTPAEILKTQMKKSWGKFSDDELYRVFCLLIEQIEALEKQMAVKPNYEADGYSDGELVYDYAECPVCGKDYEYEINDWGCNYCSNCGQKLDWSDTECD